ncbi:hypothetical protein K470DRAFT_260689, partial [Piedraia hortae CBS 480.64]
MALILLFTALALAEQPSAQPPVRAPLRELPWGQLNVLHTTDTHGWHAGHLQEPQYGADWGDYVSFAHHLQKRADEDGSDVLLVDTGDRVEGNGLYDASSPKGKYTFDILKEQRIDVMTPGNHELYIQATSDREYDEIVKDFKDAYISSNVDVMRLDGRRRPLAPRYRKFTTKNQRLRIMAFGFLFDFQENNNHTVVQPVEEVVKEKWFQDAVRDRHVDLFLVAGHVAVRDSPEYDIVYKAIRKVQWDTPIVFFGGHTHIRDYRIWDKKAQGMESGRYMETLGFLSMSGLKSKREPTYRRLYIDNNLYSLHHHSRTNSSSFTTDLGRNVSKSIHDARAKLNLDYTYGCAPQNYWLNRAPYPANDSLLTLLADKIIPDLYRDDKPTVVLFNSGAMRFDMFKGPVTVDTMCLISPFLSGIKVLKDIPYAVAHRVLGLLNNEGPIPLQDLAPLHLRRRDVEEMMVPAQAVLVNSEHARLPGYTTIDDLGSDGDDAIHAPIQFYDVPNCIGAEVNVAGTEKVSIAYNGFIEKWVIMALRALGTERSGGDAERAFGGKSVTELMTGWVGRNWKC